MNLRQLLSTVLAASAIGLLVMSTCGPRKGKTSWREVPCQVISSRVVRADKTIGNYATPTVGFRGDYGVNYIIEGRRSFSWEFAGWWDTSEEFVRNKVTVLPETCPFSVRYNPEKPDAVVLVRR
jgi:hypothetical protein